MPVHTRVQAKEGITSYIVVSDGLGDPILKGLHHHPGLGLSSLPLAHKLDLMKGDETATNTMGPTEIVEGVLKLREPELLLAVDDPS